MSEFVRRILVVEDEPDLREIIVSLIKETYSDVDEAENGEKGLEMLLTGNYMLVVSDIHMPKLTGIKFFEQAKAAGSTVPFVFITAFSDHDNMVSALRLGAFDFIRKPFENDEVTEVVNRGVEVGYRMQQISKNLQETALVAAQNIQRDEKFIRMLSLQNHRKRAV